ncbi:GAF domain-containing protein [Candidatus Halobonum tyrrellensis]|uniref:histidine kinase n=1 Tax=Candidatus Halobonum tyrrellensis G22 TaxID=1324957 RepID=V4HEV0_9EURY|nr:GAF domain-containing protein [Candidatus Halobonum tyrrellensis]ESP88643.1 multi-sensor signal transduction histidine kinase [Candidatus Halobonum tyrrellensis G22]
MTAVHTLLVVGPPNPVGDALEARAGVETRHVGVDGVREALAELDDEGVTPTAAVVCGDAAGALDDASVGALGRRGVPVVALADDSPEAAYVDGFVADAGDPLDCLLREVEWAAAGETRLQLREARRRVTSLHDGAAEIAAAPSVDDLFERTAGVIRRVLSFDHNWVGVREGDAFAAVIKQGRAEAYPDRLPLDYGVTGETYRRGEPILVTDVEACDDPAVDVDDPHDEIRSFVSVPVGEYGVFHAASTRTHAFDERDRELAALLATHVAQAYGRLCAEADLRRRETKVTRLHESIPRLIDADTESDLFERTVEIAARVLDFDRSYLLRWTGEAFVPVAGTDDDVPERVSKRGVLWRTFEEGEPRLVTDTRTDPDARPEHPETRSAISVPVGDDAVFQVLSAEPEAFDESDVGLAELLVSCVDATRERVRSEAALRESRGVVERLHAAAADIATADTEAEVVERAVGAAEGVLEFDKCVLMFHEGETLVPVGASAGSHPDGARPMHVSEGVAGRTARTGESVLIDRVEESADADPARAEYRSGLSVPVGDHGVFQAVGTDPGAFDDDDVNRAELLMAHVAVSIERVRAQDGLRAERDRLSALFENVPDAALAFELVDGEPVVREVNSRFEESFGYDAEAVIGERIDDRVVPADPEAEAEAAEMNDRLERGETVRREVRRLTADGERDFLVFVVPLTGDETNVGGYAIYSDITARKERERELERQNERLDEFASVVSHDLRNPLSIADGYLELARETGDPEHFRTIDDAIDRMRTLVDDLLALAREGRVVGDPEPVALDWAAEGAWNSVETADARLDASAAEGVTVSSDPERLRELFENLFRNAVEHGGDGVSVRVAATGRGFAVTDDGPGIPDAECERVFDAGHTTTDGGTGFGLPIVRRIAEAHGWTVRVTDGGAGGARFEFETSG